MSKSKEELDELKKEVEDFNKRAQELTMEELEQVTGGVDCFRNRFVPEPGAYPIDIYSSMN